MKTVRSYTIDQLPVAWCTHSGFGKKSFNKRHQEKQASRWQLKLQHGDSPVYDTNIHVIFMFEMPIPMSLSKKKKKQIEQGEVVYCDKRPDTTNLVKFAEDCLSGIVIKDDNIVVSSCSVKYYSKNPKTIIQIIPL